MARIDTLENFLTDVASSIKEKREMQDLKIKPENFDTEILAIEGGIKTEDGTPIEEVVYGEMGSPVTAQALEDFDSGDSFVGTKVTEVNPSVSTVQAVTGKSVYKASGDSRVLIPDQSFTSTSTSLLVYVKRDDNYVSHNIPLPDMSSWTSSTININTIATTRENVILNNEGTKIIIRGNYNLVIIDFNTDTLESTSKIYNASDFTSEIANITYSTGYNLTSLKYFTKIRIVKDYLILQLDCKLSSTTYMLLFMTKLTGASMGALEKVAELGTVSPVLYNTSDVISYENSELIFLLTNVSGTYTLRRIEIRDGSFYSHTANIITDVGSVYITRNGEYLIKASTAETYPNTIYKVNFNSGSLSVLKENITDVGQYTYLDENSEYIFDITNKKLIKVSDGTTLETTITYRNFPDFRGQYFDIQNGVVDESGYLHKLVNTGEAEYLITHSGDGDIKGIVPKSMVMGAVQEVRKLF